MDKSSGDHGIALCENLINEPVADDVKKGAEQTTAKLGKPTRLIKNFTTIHWSLSSNWSLPHATVAVKDRVISEICAFYSLPREEYICQFDDLTHFIWFASVKKRKRKRLD